jgi:hypothetical protein
MEPSNGLMPKEEGHPFSRDFAMHIPCRNRQCILHGFDGCGSPACVTINEAGVCEWFLKQQNQPNPLNGL